ncbi:hypothetical protein POTOM_011696 [Populus tomentosa]|uniref:Uncharacterized protein n=1 Tax=Populus tomentosa TaxID=118781 RepID=A0A8X8D8V5_POPTO|nr:hypothetical protein POTOM_011696 [Populus tomentosa]
MNRDPGRGRGRGRDLGRGRGRDRGRGPWRSPGGGAHWVPKGRSSDPSSHSSYSVGPDESSSGEKPFSDRDRNSQPKSRRWFPSYPNSAGNIFCQDESSSGEKPFSNRDRNSQPKSRRWFPSYPNSAGNIFCQKEPLENKSLEDSMSSTGRILHDQSAPSCSSLGSNQSDCSVASNSVNKDNSALMPAISGSRDMKSDIVSAPLEKGAKDGAVHLDYSRKLKSTVPLQNQNESHLSFQACANDQLSQEKDPNIVVSAGDSGYSEQQAVVKPCDICLPKTGTTLKLKPDCSVASNSVNKDDSPLMPAISGSRDMKSDIVSAPLEKGAKDGAVHLHFSCKLKSTVPLQNQNESHLSFQACANDQLSQEKDPNIVVSAGDSGYSEQQAVVKPCDICLPKTGTTLKLKPDCSVASNSVNKDDSPLMPAISGSRDMKSDIVSAPLEKGAKDGAVHLHFSRKLKSTVPLQNQNESHLSFQACANDQLSQEKDPNIVVSAGDSGYSEQQAVVKPCDICLPKTGTTLKLKPDCSVASNSVNKDDSPLMPAISGSRDMKSDIVSAPLEKGAKDGAVHLHFSRKLKSTVPLQNQNESHLSFQACANDQLSQEKDPNIVVSAGDSGYSEQQAVVKPCDICLPKTGTTLKLKPDCSVASNSVNKDDSPLMPAISGSRDMKSDIVSTPLEKGAKDGAVHLHFSLKG